MSFRDYSADPNANTTIGETIYIGPNMARNDVRPALQQVAADGRELYDFMLDNGPDAALTGLARIGSRSAMADLTDQSAGMIRVLAESGREGAFVFSSANLSAQVAADTAKGIYIAPSAAPTGASGAWVRRYTGPADIRWFGAVADDATDIATAVTAALAAVKAHAAVTDSYFGPTPTILFPAGKYYCGSTINLKQTVRLKGEGTGQAGGKASQIRFPATTAGIVVNRHDTSLYIVGATTDTTAADGSIIEGLALIGGGGAYNADADGIFMRARAVVRDCTISGFARHGIFIGGSSDSNPFYGNCNGWQVHNCRIDTVGQTGLRVAGIDANAGHSSGCDFYYCLAWAIYDSALGSNLHEAHQAAGCGLGNGTTDIDSVVALPAAGQRYAVIPGQEAGASTNTPPNATYWNVVTGSVGGRTWTNGITVRAGGPYRGTGTSKFDVCYSENGSGPSYMEGSSVAVGGIHGSGVNGAWRYTNTNGQQIQGNLTGSGNISAAGIYGTTSGAIGTSTSADTTFSIDTGNNVSKLLFRKGVAGTPVDQAAIYTVSGAGLQFDIKTAYTAYFSVNLANTFSYDANGLQVVSGKLGYGTGTGGTVTQATSKSTGVTLNKATGQITMNGAALAAATIVSFTLTNSQIAAGDVLILNHISGGTGGAYTLNAQSGAGTATINVRNNTAGSLSEAIVISYAVIKAVTT